MAFYGLLHAIEPLGRAFLDHIHDIRIVHHIRNEQRATARLKVCLELSGDRLYIVEVMKRLSALFGRDE